MSTIEINQENFRKIYQDNEMIVLDFWASWCGPCQQFGPTFESVSEEFPGVQFGKVDTEAQNEISSYFQIRSIPTVIIIREELEIFRSSGALNRESLQAVINQAKDADMNDIRAKIEAEEGPEEDG